MDLVKLFPYLRHLGKVNEPKIGMAFPTVNNQHNSSVRFLMGDESGFPIW